MTVEAIIALILATVFSLLGYLLKRRDDQTEKSQEAMRLALLKEISDLRALLHQHSEQHEKARHEMRQALTEEINDTKGSIRILFQKHDQDAARLEELRYHIAGGHYTKTELDQILARLEKNLTDLVSTTNTGVREVMVQVQAIGAKVDTLSHSVAAHIAKEDRS